MGDNLKDSGGRHARRMGCAAAAVFGLPVFIFLLLNDALGDCAPDTICRKGFLPMVLIPSVVIASIMGLTVGFLVKKSTPPT